MSLTYSWSKEFLEAGKTRLSGGRVRQLSRHEKIVTREGYGGQRFEIHRQCSRQG